MSKLTPSQIRAQVGKWPVRFKEDPKISYVLNNTQNDDYGFFEHPSGEIKRKFFRNVISINGKPINTISKLHELKQLIKEEIEAIKISEPLTFEGNPLEFTLNKYPSLNDTLVDLLTPSFRDYIIGIFIVAPKPTTFRILLHNNQEFYLIYAPNGYVAKISGKKYDLRNLSEEEFAITSIAQLLELGMPPGSEGPNEPSDNQADIQGETPDETPPAEAAPEEETPSTLKESKKKFKIKI